MNTIKLLAVAWKKLPAPIAHPHDRIKIMISPAELESQEEVTRSESPDATGADGRGHEIEFYKKEQAGEIIWEVGNIS
ncbi:MAG: hypothetical protein JWQ14_3152 [Adhaeribacter sp.]|nr:hypothetical protein [Adhaeribacter sp.]